MTAIIIVTHDALSDAIIKTSKAIYGTIDNILAVNFDVNEGLDTLTSKIENAYKQLDTEDGALILVDIFGGTPMNASLFAATKLQNVKVITGVNIPMVLEILGSRENCSMSELAEIAKDAAKSGIRVVN
ncbi:MAG: PTS sugar transporter subunit IIA [Tepidanaerobacter acetatoxydans]|uniref:PTS sugar transporter subunit IIA n=1 Tax=Tepidanaerobacter TaxID=499228 RepID=UPI000A43E215|nr:MULTISPECIES: PTS sugar transporter subunit IIA [Tepidanaerobacter]NLU10322.1 PTS sugar transporter subunit IIA [Tepidanaerobacter acetatoxydans]